MLSPAPEPDPPSDPAPARHHPAPAWALPAAVLGGGMGALQSRLNSHLASDIHDGFTAAAISFGLGLVLLVGLYALSPRLRRGAGAFAGELRSGSFAWPLALGGLGGATFVLAQGLTVSRLGVALFILCVVAGQTVTGLAVDLWGLGPGGRRPLTPPRVVGAILMVAAVAIAMSGGISSAPPWHVLALPILAGIAVGAQQTVNGHVSGHTRNPTVATLGNFVTGTAALVPIAIGHALLTGRGPGPLPTNPVLYLGGVIGVVFIAMATRLVHPLGVLTLAMATISGQIITSVILDVLAPTSSGRPGLLTLVGSALTLVAAVLTAGVGRRGSRAVRPPATR